MKYIWSLAFMSVLALMSCNKTGVDNILDPKTDYAFKNNTGKTIIVKVIDTVTGGEPFNLLIPPGHLGSIPNSRLVRNNIAAGFIYYWASTDFKMSSWYLQPVNTANKSASFGYNRVRYNYTIGIAPVNESMRMLYCLNGIDGTTQWTAVDAKNKAGQSVWDTLNNINKNHVITLDWGRGGTHTHSGSTGANIKDYFSYSFNDSIGKDVWLNSYYYSSADPAFSGNYTMTITNDLTGWAPLSTTSTDTLYMMIEGKGPYYIMVRQHQ